MTKTGKPSPIVHDEYETLALAMALLRRAFANPAESY
jgi:hypothetical protein